MFKNFDDFMIDILFRRFVKVVGNALDALECAIIALVGSLVALVVMAAASSMCWLLVVFAIGLYVAIMSRMFVLRREQLRPTPDFEFRAKDYDLRAFTTALMLVMIVVDATGREVGWVEPGLVALAFFAVSNWFAACSEVGRGKGRRVTNVFDYDDRTVIGFPGRRPT